MYCKHCGVKNPKGALRCEKCEKPFKNMDKTVSELKPKKDEAFCTNCGKIIKRAAVICPHCRAAAAKSLKPAHQAKPLELKEDEPIMIPIIPFIEPTTNSAEIVFKWEKPSSSTLRIVEMPIISIYKEDFAIEQTYDPWYYTPIFYLFGCLIASFFSHKTKGLRLKKTDIVKLMISHKIDAKSYYKYKTKQDEPLYRLYVKTSLEPMYIGKGWHDLSKEPTLPGQIERLIKFVFMLDERDTGLEEITLDEAKRRLESLVSPEKCIYAE